jgi:hypothetical protein
LAEAGTGVLNGRIQSDSVGPGWTTTGAVFQEMPEKPAIKFQLSTF